MKREQLHINKGFSLVELLISLAVFLVFVTVTVNIIVNTNKQVLNSNNKDRATSLVEEGLEAARNIRDVNWEDLTVGTYGLSSSGNKWSLIGTSDVTDIFTRSLIISNINANQKKVIAIVSWSDKVSQNNSINANTYLTNWRAPLDIGLTIDKVVIGGTKIPSDFLPYNLNTNVWDNTVDPPVLRNTDIPIVFAPSIMSDLSPGIFTFLTTSDPNYDVSVSSACTGNSITLIDTPTICTITYTSNNVGCTGTPWGDMLSGTSNTAYQTTLPTGACTSETRICTNGTLSGSYTATSCTAGCTGTLWGDVASGYSNTAYQTSSVTYPSTCTSETRTCTAGTFSGSYTNTSCVVNPILPTITTTSPITNITRTIATGGGNTISNGGATVSVAGIVWSTSINPTTALSTKTTDGWALGGPWISSITSLSCGTLYHVRAYATNSVGTSYGSDITFTTSACSNISFVGSASTSGTNATVPTHLAGDLLIAFAYRDGNILAPTLAAGWTNINSSNGASSNGSRLAYRIATGTDLANGWSNATEVIIQVYRGISGSPIGVNTTSRGNSSIVSYPALTPSVLNNSSWVIGFAGHRRINTTLENSPTGMTRRSTLVDAKAEVSGHDTNSGVSSWPTTTVSVGGTSSGWMTRVLEIKSN